MTKVRSSFKTLRPRVCALLNWLGSETGGMMVHIIGRTNKGQRRSRTWELTAESNHGPEIPCMAAVTLAIKLARGQRFSAGAKICMDILELADFEPEFARWNISTRVMDDL